MNRRKFCLSSVAAAIAGAAAGQAATLAPPVAPRPSVPLYKIIYDRRFSAGRVFGAAAEQIRSTAGTIAIDGDITALWSRGLRLRWSIGDGAIAGMTTARTLFCLEQLAKDHWMRVVIRVEHAISDGHEFMHRLTGSQAMMERFTAVLAAGNWPAQMPAALTTCLGTGGANGAGGEPRATCMLGSPCGRRFCMAGENLVSFVIV